jgi:hypothetical protein
MKQDDINLFEAYAQVVSSNREQLDEAGVLARTGARLGALGGAVKQGLKAFTQGGSEGFTKSYQMGKQQSIISKIADETVKNIESLGLIPAGTKLSPEDKNELVGMLNKFIESRGGLSATGQQGQALENPKGGDSVPIGGNTYEFDDASKKWEKLLSGGSTQPINVSDEVQNKITDEWRKSKDKEKAKDNPDFSAPATPAPTPTASPKPAAAPKPAPKPFKLGAAGKGPKPKPKASR